MPFTSTYRLQLHEGFGFCAAREVVPYLARLGVSHLYLSPILQAVAGSMHGYDVVDHSRVNSELGGYNAYVELVEEAKAHDLGIVVDVVPNHMAFVAPESVNLPLWAVLRDGRDADTAHWFDIDWKAGGGRIGLPVLGEDLQTVLESGELVIDEIPDPWAVHAASADLGHRSRARSSGGPVSRLVSRRNAPEVLAEPTPALVVRYHEHVYPIALGTEGDARPGDSDAATVRNVLERQHYRLASWRDKDDVLNYRRFFEVDGLIAVRVELPDVFDATHELLLELNHDGLIDGFRIDHPDGLADPGGYLQRLHKAARKGTPVWVEKILEGSEDLPTDWKCAGTTGYDAMRAVQAAVVDTADEPTLTAAWVAAGGTADIEEEVVSAKRQVVDQSLVPEVERLTRRAREANLELDPERLRAAVVELLVAGEVYRAYLRPDEGISAEARERLSEAFARAIASRPDLGEELRALVPLTVAHHDDPSTLDFSVRLQQTWGPVMAKGIEDTTFYRWHRLIALNEVGGDPTDLDRPTTGPESGAQLLHDWAARQTAHWPVGMTTLSTHDTKRSEDVRARILAVAGDAQAWAACSQATLEAAQAAGVDGQTAHLVWQTILGVGPISSERLDGYLEKALREAKLHTAWVDGDPDYEARVLDFAHTLRDAGPVHDAIEAAVVGNAEAIRATILTAKALALTMPGMPDTYQGCEIVDLSLVDPDNRRPVDYAAREQLLARLDAAAAADGVPAPGAEPAESAEHVVPSEPSEPSELAGPAEPVAVPDAAVAADPAAAADPEVAADGAGGWGPVGDLDAEKLWLTSRLLRLRREHPEPFDGDYEPLATEEHLIGYVRTATVGRLASVLRRTSDEAVAVLVTRAPARLAAAGGWGDQAVELPEGTWLDVLSGARHTGGVAASDVFWRYPVAVLHRQ